MSVNGVSTNTSVQTEYQNKNVANKKKNSDSVKKTDSKTQTVENGAVYEKSGKEDTKVTYSINQMSADERASLVEKLLQDQENRKSQLSSLVKDMLSKQAGASDLASLFSAENLAKVSPEEIAQAKEDVSEDGYWGVKQTSQRLFDFACALAGDDVDKMKEMQEAMEKGYKQAMGAWGKELPQICQDTIAAANQMFEDYYKSKETA